VTQTQKIKIKKHIIVKSMTSSLHSKSKTIKKFLVISILSPKNENVLARLPRNILKMLILYYNYPFFMLKWPFLV